MFAIDAVKLPSNVGKARSGTRADFVRQAVKIEDQVQKMLCAHREADAAHDDTAELEKYTKRAERLKAEAA